MSAEATNLAGVASSEGKERLWKAFFAGFMSSGEGWNGEWPFENHATPEKIASVKECFDKWLDDPTTVPEPNYGQTAQFRMAISTEHPSHDLHERCAQASGQNNR